MGKDIESVNDFILNGQFKTAPFGMDKTEFIKQFGKSEDYLTVSEKDTRISLLKYGITEFYFDEPHNYEKLSGVLFQPMTFPSDKLKFEIDLQWITNDLTYAEVGDILNREGIEFQEKKDEIQQNIIETSSEVIFYFYDEEDKELEDWELNKFGRFKI